MVGTSSFGYNAGTNYQTLPIGAGGFVTDIDFAKDGTLICRNDSGLAYKYSSTQQQWNNIVTVSSMGGTAPTLARVHEIVVAPSNSNRMYMISNGAMYRSNDGGNTWSLQAGFSALVFNTVPFNNQYRLNGHKMAVDPVNPDIVIAGTGADGLFITTNGGGVWSKVAGVPAALPDITTATSGSTKSTNAVTTASNVLHFSSTPTGVVVGHGVTANALYSLIPPGTTVTLVSGGDITISNTVTVPSNTSISFSPAVNTGTTAASLTFATLPTSAVSGRYVFNYTNPISIPAGTTVTGTTGSVVNISNTVTVAAGDMIVFTDLSSANTLYPSYCLAFDPTTSSGGSTSGMYAFAWGSPIYQSTNGGTTWAPLTTGGANAGPRFHKQIRFGPDGTLWIVSDNQDLISPKANFWSYSGPGITTSTVPTQLATALVGSQATVAVAINPNDVAPNIRVIVQSTDLSVDNGATWTGTFNGATTPTVQAGRIPWLGLIQTPAVAAQVYDPTAPNTLWVAHGVGAFNGNPPTGTLSGLALAGNSNPASQYRHTFLWTDQGAGIESLTPTSPISPIGAPVIFPTYDRAGFSKTDVKAYPTNNIRGDVATLGIVAGYSMCISVSDPTFMAGAVNNSGGANAHISYSTNSGVTWQDFPTQPGVVGQGGTIAATTPQHIVYIGSNIAGGAQPYVTTNQGLSWALTDLPNVNGYVLAYFDANNCICADVNDVDTMYIYCFVSLADVRTGVYKSTNGGVNWTKVIAGNTGGAALINPVNVAGGNARLASVPGQSAGTLLYCGAPIIPTNILYITTDGALTWNTINSNLTHVVDYNFGKSAPGSSNPTLFVIGTYNSVTGIFRSTDLGVSFTQIGSLNPVSNLPNLVSICGDSNLYGRVYCGMQGTGYCYGDYISG